MNKIGVQDGVQDVQERLKRIKLMDELINAKLAERDQLVELATSITPNLDGMPRGSGTSDKVGNAAVRLVVMAKEIDRLIDQYVDFKREVIGSLEKLPEVEYLVLHKRYVQGLSWGRIAKDMNYSRQQVWRVNVKALESLKHVT